MFTATTTKKDFREGVFQVSVSFTDGTETITEAFNIYSKEDLDRRIEDRLNALNRLLDLKTSLVLGVWTKPVKPTEPKIEPIPLTIEQLKEQEINTKEIELTTELERAKREQEINLLATTDAVFAQKLAEYEALKTQK